MTKVTKKRKQSDLLVSGGAARAHGRNASQHRATNKRVNGLPRSNKMRIQVDFKNKTLLLPIDGNLVPFRMANVKSVSTKADTNGTCIIHISFNVPVQPLENRSYASLKEASFRSKDPSYIDEVVEQIKTLKRQEYSMRIQVDFKNETLLLPIDGILVPYRIANVKSVSTKADINGNCIIHISFNVPVQPLENRSYVSLKEVSFRSKDPSYIDEVVEQIKTLKRQENLRE
ncbi:FACT complex subunit SPT16 [Artemisia annua]|uniref:FACT complex subunit n=1 Tax=Artemisia annua TaxID=35608 RepID=A0A2U1P5Y4_ARTAN|nr:FACT complex subunit SPT16 [Artemisia annua]